MQHNPYNQTQKADLDIQLADLLAANYQVIQYLNETASNCQQGADQLERKLAQVDSIVHQAVQQRLALVHNETKEEITRANRQVSADFAAEVESLQKQMLDFSRFAGRCEQKLNRAGNRVWLALTLPALGILLLGLWLGLYYKDIINNNKMTADSLRRYQNADIVICGENLCAKTGDTPPEYKKRGYTVIKPK